MHNFQALGIEDEATQSLLYILASVRRGGYGVAHSHSIRLSELVQGGQLPAGMSGDAKLAKAINLALHDRYTEAQARAAGDEEHKDPKSHANPNPTRPSGAMREAPAGEPRFQQDAGGGRLLPADSPQNAEAAAGEWRREQAGQDPGTAVRDLMDEREKAARTRQPPPDAAPAPAEVAGIGQLPDPNAEDGGLGDEAAPKAATSEGEGDDEPAPKKRRARKAG